MLSRGEGQSYRSKSRANTKTPYFREFLVTFENTSKFGNEKNSSSHALGFLSNFENTGLRLANAKMLANRSGESSNTFL